MTLGKAKGMSTRLIAAPDAPEEDLLPPLPPPPAFPLPGLLPLFAGLDGEDELALARCFIFGGKYGWRGRIKDRKKSSVPLGQALLIENVQVSFCSFSFCLLVISVSSGSSAAISNHKINIQLKRTQNFRVAIYFIKWFLDLVKKVFSIFFNLASLSFTYL